MESRKIVLTILLAGQQSRPDKNGILDIVGEGEGGKISENADTC